MINAISLSLSDLLGMEYMASVSQAAISFLGKNPQRVAFLAEGKVEFFNSAFQEHLDGLVDKVGTTLVPPFRNGMRGAPTASFSKAANLGASPLTGLGCFRLGEDGRLYLASKSEHYHTTLGHNFPGYTLIDNARELGILNATHNNTRGYITRLCERELIRVANGIGKDDTAGLEAILAGTEPHILNRVINLETGSIACEAAMKMMLARFYKLEKTSPPPKYQGKIPVFFVIGDFDGGRVANYHGTTIIAQTFRDMWPDLYARFGENQAYKVCQVKINDFDDFKTKFEAHQRGDYKVAGFIHEIILMNYGGIRLTQDYLRQAYELCHANDTPVLCDEIQSCMWYDGMFLFRKYGLNPDFVSVGKGFPGGQYPASRILLNHGMDNLNQFGALVTNGQEELAALAYLITMAFVERNAVQLREINTYYTKKCGALVQKYPSVIDYLEGDGLLSAITFHDVDKTIDFVRRLNEQCIDISAQVYKAFCPPAALLKLPIISSPRIVDWLVGKMDATLMEMSLAP